MKRYHLNHQLFPLSKHKVKYMEKNQDKIIHFLSKKPAWDYTFYFSFIKEGAFGIIPSFNLTKNIGCFGEHNKGANEIVHYKAVSSLEKYPITKHPPFVVPDYLYEQNVSRIIYKRSLIYYRIKRKIVKYIRQLLPHEL